MGMRPENYSVEADFAATGSVICDDCGIRVRAVSPATLPYHGCAAAQNANRLTLALVVQRRVFRDVAGDVQVWNIDGPQPVTEPVNYAALARLAAAGMVAFREIGREPYYEIMDRALSGD
jgi:hypothetical protein